MIFGLGLWSFGSFNLTVNNFLLNKLIGESVFKIVLNVLK